MFDAALLPQAPALLLKPVVMLLTLQVSKCDLGTQNPLDVRDSSDAEIAQFFLQASKSCISCKYCYEGFTYWYIEVGPYQHGRGLRSGGMFMYA